MVRPKSGKIKLPYDLELKNDEMTLVVAYPRHFYRGIYGDRWGRFIRSLLSNIKESSENSLKTPRALVENAYERATSYITDDFSLGRVDNGYYFPRMQRSSNMGADYELTHGLGISHKNLLFEYPSEMITSLGEKVTIQKTYFGRVKEIFSDGTVAILVNGYERKTFTVEKISYIETVISTSGEMRYTLLHFSKIKGKSYLQWSQISSQDKVLKTFSIPAEQNTATERPLNKFEGLAHLKGKLVRVHYEQANQPLAMVMKLNSYRYTAANDRLSIFGENGVTLTGFRESFKVEELSNSK